MIEKYEFVVDSAPFNLRDLKFDPCSIPYNPASTLIMVKHISARINIQEELTFKIRITLNDVDPSGTATTQLFPNGTLPGFFYQVNFGCYDYDFKDMTFD